MFECPICLNEVSIEDESFLLPQCYHCFHYLCILRWTEAQQKHPSPGYLQYLCPLCKRPYTTIIHSCVNKSFKCHNVEGSHVDSELMPLQSLLHLTAEQQRRRSVYMRLQESEKGGLQIQHAGLVSGSTAAARKQLELGISRSRPPPRKPTDPMAKEWMRRDLQAILMQQDVELVLQHAWGTLQAAASNHHRMNVMPGSSASIQAAVSNHHRMNVMPGSSASIQAAVSSQKNSKSAAGLQGFRREEGFFLNPIKSSNMKRKRPSLVLASDSVGRSTGRSTWEVLADAMVMFLNEDSLHFVNELQSFLSTGLSIEAYDARFHEMCHPQEQGQGTSENIEANEEDIVELQASWREVCIDDKTCKRTCQETCLHSSAANRDPLRVTFKDERIELADSSDAEDAEQVSQILAINTIHSFGLVSEDNT
ncbi:hypothetical protein CEUSTIGMA_g9583.t1 [Chlamydomonas eustigma]|uniref:RING-type domain-containing protein n=1 Tax=Chlamydomonas eustigma TaxID=1157962 RepID=A0A250XGF0_9CHLO|nr:hypothetical protein CEUSTIGMA_g9583.t1 [Chlamydomonas eustigma]|eukprot:GAX82155.1 hypothetical protein CEUSTIGMA_g9583.t1 [Chlamydomonas eustigma]